MDEEIQIRDAVDGDEAFLREVYFSTRAAEVAIFGWDDVQTRAFLEMQFELRERAYAMQFPGAVSSIILVAGEPAGRMIVERRDAEISLTDIAVLPQFQGRGIASQLIGRLQAEASAAGVPLVLSVDRTNDHASKLYEKLGFVVTGETQMNFSMQWTPPAL